MCIRDSYKIYVIILGDVISKEKRRKERHLHSMENPHLQQPKRKGGECLHNCAIILHAVVIFAEMRCIGMVLEACCNNLNVQFIKSWNIWEHIPQRKKIIQTVI